VAEEGEEGGEEEGEEARVKRGGSGDKNVLTVRLRRAISESGGVE